jgi:hypothetical protein
MLFRPLSDLPFSCEVGATWDSTTPDFTGPIVDGDDHELVDKFHELHGAFAREMGIVAGFAHLHPWSRKREELLEGSTYNSDIVWVDVAVNPETLFAEHFDRSCVKNINKAKREGVEVSVESSDEAIEEFFRIYTGTMQRNQAHGRYAFSLSFFREIRDNLPQNARFTFARHGGKMVAATLYMHDDDNVYSYLGGADAEFNSLRPTNLVIWETIQWAHATGKKRLILGAGLRPDDGIYRFKATFSPLRQPFYVHKRVYRPEDFAALDRRCREHHSMGGESVEYFPSYRYAPE